MSPTGFKPLLKRHTFLIFATKMHRALSLSLVGFAYTCISFL
jgi:hypothetical protein